MKDYQKILARIEENPHQFPVDLDPNLPQNDYRKALFGKWYKALFRVVGQQIYLDFVLDGRRMNDYFEN